MDRLGGDGVRELLNGHEVDLEDAPAVRADDQFPVARLDRDVVHRRRRQVRAQGNPGCAARLADVDAALIGADVERRGAAGIFADDVDLLVRQPGREGLPGLPEIGGLENVGPIVVLSIAGQGDVGRAQGVARRHDAADPLSRQVASDLRPLRAVVARDPHAAVVGPDIEQAGTEGGLADGGDGPVGHVALLLGAGLRREVRADRHPGVATVERAEQPVGAEVDDPRVKPGDDERRHPVVAEGRLAVRGLGLDAPDLPGPHVLALEIAELLLEVDRVRVGRIDRRHVRIAAAPQIDPHVFPRVLHAVHRHAVRRPEQRGVVLRAAVDGIRIALVHGDRVELADRNVVEMEPRRAAIGREVHAAVVAEDHVPGIGGIDPQIVMVEMQGRRRMVVEMRDQAVHLLKRAAAIVRSLEIRRQRIEQIRVVGRHDDDAVRAEPDAVVLHRELAPMFAAVVGAIDLRAGGDRAGPLRPGVLDGRLVRDERVDRLGRGRRHGQADAADERAARQSAGQLLPRLAAVNRLVDAGPRAVLDRVPRRAIVLVRRRVDRVGTRRIEDHVSGPGLVRDVQHLLPRLAAVLRPEQAPLLVGREQMAERGDKDDVGVGRMDGDAPDVMGVGQPQVSPGRARVHRLEDAKAGERTPSQQLLAGSHIQHVRVRGRHRDVTNRAGRLVVEDRRPGHAVIDRLPHRSGSEAGVDDAGAGHGGDRFDPAALQSRAERLPAEAAEGRRLPQLDVTGPRLHARILGRCGGGQQSDDQSQTCRVHDGLLVSRSGAS